MKPSQILLALITGFLALPTLAVANETNFSVTTPTRTGPVTVIVTVKDANGKKTQIPWSVVVNAGESKEQKAKNIEAAAPDSSNYIKTSHQDGTNVVKVESKDGYTVVGITFKGDTTGERSTPNIFSATGDDMGLASFEGTASGFDPNGMPSEVIVETAGAVALVHPFPGMSADEIEDEVFAQLAAQGVSVHFMVELDEIGARYGSEFEGDGRVLVVETVADPGLTVGTDDELLTVDLAGMVDAGARIGMGTNYCGPAVPNSSGDPAVIYALGSSYVSKNDLTLGAYDLPANKLGYFLTSPNEAFIENPGGSKGNLCLGSGVLRFSKSVLSSGDDRRFELDVDPENLPGGKTILPGETWRFQCWFRDIDPGSTSNFTDGIWIEWQ